MGIWDELRDAARRQGKLVVQDHGAKRVKAKGFHLGVVKQDGSVEVKVKQQKGTAVRVRKDKANGRKKEEG